MKFAGFEFSNKFRLKLLKPFEWNQKATAKLWPARPLEHKPYITMGKVSFLENLLADNKKKSRKNEAK